MTVSPDLGNMSPAELEYHWQTERLKAAKMRVASHFNELEAESKLLELEMERHSLVHHTPVSLQKKKRRQKRTVATGEFLTWLLDCEEHLVNDLVDKYNQITGRDPDSPVAGHPVFAHISRAFNGYERTEVGAEPFIEKYYNEDEDYVICLLREKEEEARRLIRMGRKRALRHRAR